MKEVKYYDTTPAQNTIFLQLKYTLFKRVCNILCSVTLSEKADWTLMKDSFNLLVQRNDCTRIYFKKSKKKILQYFRDELVFDEIPVLTFKTEDQQKAWIKKTSKKAIDYMNGHVVDPVFINTWDGKSMVFFKVCHCVLDVYGINVLFTDLMGIYQALKNKTELPPQPGSYEELVKKDLVQEEKSYERDAEYLKEYLNKPMPYYAGLHGDNSKIWKKRADKGIHSMKMFFFQNNSDSAIMKIEPAITEKVIKWCTENNKSITSFFLYTFQLTSSLINHKTESILSLELCNCRATALEKKTAGTKVQSVMRYTTVDYKKTFTENLNVFTSDEAQLYRHINFPDPDAEMILHGKYKYGLMDTLYNCTFSLIPLKKIPGVKFDLYSNGKFIVPSYIALMFDVDTNEIDMLYEYQIKIITKQDIENFHKKYLEVINAVLNNPELKLSSLS